MTFDTYRQSFLRNDLTAFKLLERIIAAVCITIPAFLRLADTGANGWRSSISDYVYMCNSHVFGMMLCMASMLFIVNGAVFFKNENKHNLNNSSKWYNIALGLSLLGVIIFPYKEYGVPHFTFAGLFFAGNAFVTVAAARHKKHLAIRWVYSPLYSLSCSSLTTISNCTCNGLACYRFFGPSGCRLP